MYKREPSGLSFETAGSAQYPPNYSSLSRGHSDESADQSPDNTLNVMPNNLSSGSIRSQKINNIKKLSMDHIPRAYELKNKRSASGTPSESSSCSSGRKPRKKKISQTKIGLDGRQEELEMNTNQSGFGKDS